MKSLATRCLCFSAVLVSVVIQGGAQLGGSGYGFASSREGHVKIPQLGRVIVQDPAAGSTARRSRTVKVWLSAGQHAALIPTLTGETERTAQLRLAQQHDNGEFVFTVTGEAVTDQHGPGGGWRLRRAGTSLRYGAITALGLLRLPSVSPRAPQLLPPHAQSVPSPATASW